jgi:hypothetical protein
MSAVATITMQHWSSRKPGCAWRAHELVEERLFGRPERQSRAGVVAHSGLDCRLQARLRRSVRVCVEIAQDAEQDGERGQPLKTVHDLEHAG